MSWARSWPSGSVTTSVAFTASWPSRKTVAVTSNSSPTTDFAGRAPWSTHGRTFWTGMRPMGDWGAEVCGAFTPGTLPPSGAARTHVGSFAAYARMLMASTLTAPGSTSESTSCGRSHALSHSSR